MIHLHRWTQWTAPVSDLVDAIKAFEGRPFRAESLPSGWYQLRTCRRCGYTERREL